MSVTFGSYINADSNESNGCTPSRLRPDAGINAFTGVKTPGACNNKILLSVSRTAAPRSQARPRIRATQTLVTQSPGPARHTDQFWQWTAFTRDGKLAVDYYDRQYGHDETTGSSDFSLSGSDDLAHFGQIRLTTSSMPAPTAVLGDGRRPFYGDYVWLPARDKAYPIWSDTRATDLFLCPGTADTGRSAGAVQRHRDERRAGQRRGDVHGAAAERSHRPKGTGTERSSVWGPGAVLSPCRALGNALAF